MLSFIRLLSFVFDELPVEKLVPSLNLKPAMQC